MKKFWNWLMITLGLRKRPTLTAPTPPTAPPTTAPPAPKPTPVTKPSPTFHGFWLRRGKYAYERELTQLQIGPQVTGCPPDEIRYGYEDNGSGPYKWRMLITEIEGGKKNAVYDEYGQRIDGQWCSDRSAVWFPLWCEDQPYFPFSSPKTMGACPKPPTPPPAAEPHNTTPIRIDLWIQNADGVEAHWKQIFEAVSADCS